MRKALIILNLLLCPMALFPDTDGNKISITEYVEMLLANSHEIDSALGNAEQAQETFEIAKLNRESAYNLELLENEHLLKQAEILSTENAEIILAFERMFTSIAAAKTLEFAAVSKEIAAAEYKRAEELSQKEYISSLQKRMDRLAFLQASLDERAAAFAYSASQKALIRPIKKSWDTLEIEKFTLSVDIPEMPDAKEVINQNITVIKLRADLSLYGKRRDFLRESTAGSAAEFDEISSTIGETEKLLQQLIWTLQDDFEGLQLQIHEYELHAEIANLNGEITLIELQQTRHQYENGDIHASDVLQAELLYNTVVEQQLVLQRERILHIMQVLYMTNVSLKDWIYGTWGDIR